MFNRLPRWTCLALFASCNLLFWVAMAVGVGVLASDKVNLGVETFLRTQHATAIAAWSKASIEPAQITALPMTLEAASPTKVEAAALPAKAQATTSPKKAQVVAAPTKAGAAASPTVAAQASRPTRTSTVEARAEATVLPPADTPKAPEPRPTGTTPATTPTAIPTARQVARATVQPTAVANSNPLLVSDPDLKGLALIDAEMSRSAAGRPVQIRYGEEALNGMVSALVASDPDLPYQNLHIDLKRDGVLLSGTITVMGFQVQTEVEGSVVARDCVLETEIQRIAIAGLVTPAFVRDSIRTVVEESLDWYPADYPLCLEQIVLEEDWVTIYGSRR
jgi:hypothetical protein